METWDAGVWLSGNDEGRRSNLRNEKERKKPGTRTGRNGTGRDGTGRDGTEGGAAVSKQRERPKKSVCSDSWLPTSPGAPRKPQQESSKTNPVKSSKNQANPI